MHGVVFFFHFLTSFIKWVSLPLWLPLPVQVLYMSVLRLPRYGFCLSFFSSFGASFVNALQFVNHHMTRLMLVLYLHGRECICASYFVYSKKGCMPSKVQLPSP